MLQNNHRPSLSWWVTSVAYGVIKCAVFIVLAEKAASTRAIAMRGNFLELPNSKAFPSART